MSNKIIRITDVKEKTGLSRSGIYAKIAQGTFPPQVALGQRAVGWVESEVEAWIEDRITQTRSINHNQFPQTPFVALSHPINRSSEKKFIGEAA